MQADLFAQNDPGYRPLAERMRPQRLADYVGQGHILGKDKPLYQAIAHGKLHSMIFWGAPGTGKTSLARLLAAESGAVFVALSAVLSGVKEIRAAIDSATAMRAQNGKKTILFVDEVHRFNKSQQDAFLPHIENGTLIFIGATTENPSFALNNALLSRARSYVLKSLSAEDIGTIVQRALNDQKNGLGALGLAIAPQAAALLTEAADGDARKALNLLEICADLCEGDTLDEALVLKVAANNPRRFDKGGDIFYEQISALHKSVRGSNPDGALYWLCRMLDGGCDPDYIARRLVRMASEEVGNADPRALELALNAWQAYERIGSPEADLNLAHAAVYLACAPKSNAVYTAFKKARQAVRDFGSQDVPIHLRNAPTKWMSAQGYGVDYRYSHDEPHAYSAGQTYLPEAMRDVVFYQPKASGLEQKIVEKLKFLRQLDDKSG